MVVLVVMLGLWVWLVFVDGASYAAASNHNWGSGTPYRECTNRGLTNYGPKTGQKWIGGRYKNLYRCTTPTTTAPRAPDWGSGTPYRECTDRGLTNYGPKTGQKWIGGRYKNLYRCTTPPTTTPPTTTPPTTTTTRPTTTTAARKVDWGSGTPYRECGRRGLTNYGSRTGQMWVGDFYADLYRCIAAGATRVADWGSGRPYRECKNEGLTNYGLRKGQIWIAGAIKDLYQCRAPTTTTSSTPTTTTVPSTTTTTAPTTTTTSVPVAPGLQGVSRLPFRGVSRVTLVISHVEQFTGVEYYYKCPTQSGVDPYQTGPLDEPVVSFLAGPSRWVVVLRWEDVTTGSGPDECYGGPVSLFVRVQTDSGWSEWGQHSATIDPPPTNLHPTPTLSSPSSASVSYNATTRVSMTVTSSRVFSAWEYRYVCWEADGDRYVSAVGDTWPSNPTVSGLDETAWWMVTTGGDDDQCFSRPRASQVWLYVRVKSASTEWSDWVYYDRVSIDLSPVAPTFTNVSHDAEDPVGFGQTVEVSARVEHDDVFTRVQQYVSCRNRGGGEVDLRGADGGKSPVFTGSVFRTREWDVTTGDGSGECYHTSSAALFARVLTSDGWSRWGSGLVPVADPVCTVDVPVDMDTREQEKWFVDCTDLHRREGEFAARRYRVTLPNSTDYFPIVINVSSSTDFNITLVGGSSSVLIDSEEGSSQGSVRGGSFSGRMVKALGVSHTTYTIEISTTNTDTFGVVIDWFELQPPTNLKANGDSRGFTSGRSKVTWNPVPHIRSYEIRYVKDCPPQPCTGVGWSSPQTVNTNRPILTNLESNVLYRVVVRSVLEKHRSAWSEPLFTYPTTAPLPVNRAVATLRFEGYWNPPQYNYKLCSDTIPTTTIFDWNSEIRKGIAKWQTVADSMVTVNHTVGDCTSDVRGTDLIGNQIRILSDVAVGIDCRNPDAGACVMQYASNGELTQVIMLLSIDLATHPISMCSAVLNGAVHEGGHALGFRKHTFVPSVMAKALCEPQPYDIVAIKALYQSRSTESG